VDDPAAGLRRHRGLQLASTVLGWGGLLVAVGGVASDLEALAGGTTDPARMAVPAGLLLLGALLLLVGLLLSAVRAVIVRGSLPPERYRGPGIGVLLLLGAIAGSIPAALAGTDAMALLTGGELTVTGSLVLLTSTQVGLLLVAGGLVIAPRALQGVRLLPASGGLRQLLLGLGLVVPAWIAAAVLGLAGGWLLEAVGITPPPQVAEQAIASVDPMVVLLAFVLVAPVAEEIFFRGVVFSAWEREYGPRRALLGSAALFAVIHVEISALLPIFGLGLILGELYRRTHSLLAVIGLHAGFNAVSVSVALLMRFDVLQLPT